MTTSTPSQPRPLLAARRWPAALAALLVHWLAPALHDGPAAPLHWAG